ncbi:hypothetical protein D3C78_1983580 [compost metagenome]
MGQVQAAMKRADGRWLDEALGHAAAGAGSELEVEIPQLALKDLPMHRRTHQQAGKQQG